MKQLKAFFFDLSINLYIYACIQYLINHFMETEITFVYSAAIALISTALLTILHSSFYTTIGLKERNNKEKVLLIIYATILVLLTSIVGSVIVEFKPVKFFTKFSNIYHIAGNILHPNVSILPDMIHALIETIFLALMATIFAVPFAFIISFFGARNLIPNTFIGNFVYYIVRTIATIIRSIEVIVWAIIFCVWVGIGPFAGMLALFIHSVAALIKLYSEQIEGIDRGLIEAIEATGASFLQVWFYAVIPQILNPFLAFTIYRWDINIRMATIVGFVGGGGIGLVLQQQQQMLEWSNVGLIMWLIAITVWVMDIISGKVRASLEQ